MVQCGETTTATISFEDAEVVRRNTEEVLAKGNFELFDELFADNFLDHDPPPGFKPDKDGVRETRYFALHFLIFTPRFIGNLPTEIA